MAIQIHLTEELISFADQFALWLRDPAALAGPGKG